MSISRLNTRTTRLGLQFRWPGPATLPGTDSAIVDHGRGELCGAASVAFSGRSGKERHFVFDSCARAPAMIKAVSPATSLVPAPQTPRESCAKDGEGRPAEFPIRETKPMMCKEKRPKLE